jgi:hypothetical protein
VKTFAWVAVAVLLVSPGARADDAAGQPGALQGRGGLSVFGLSLAALGVGGLGVGIAGVLTGATLDSTAKAYQPYMQADATVIKALADRRDAATTLTITGFVAGGALLVTGVVCLLLDQPGAPVVTLVPTREGAVLSLALRWP